MIYVMLHGSSQKGTENMNIDDRAFHNFMSLVKQWMIHEKLGHDAIVGRCNAVAAYCDEMNVKEPGSYYPALKALVQQFRALLAGEET